MASKALLNLSLGTSSFRALRQARQIYVDKTQLIFDLASQRRKYFLARPRRFGKSLLISTFETLFKNGLEDFCGLAIEKLWKEERTYSVVKFDFSEIKPLFGITKFEKALKDRLIDNFSGLGFSYDPNSTSLFSQLSKWLGEQPANSLVVLIDEYDAPLTSCLNDRTLFNEVRGFLSEFYALLKANDEAIRFLFITGITKFNKASIFSELNNLVDISLNPQFGSLLGYTHEEVEKYFDSYLLRASTALNLSKEDLLKTLTKQYDGFCFEVTAKQKVFSPWSLLNFFEAPGLGFCDYWFESGGRPSVLLEYVKSHSIRDPKEYGREKTISLASLSGSSDVESLSDIGLFTQAGYLTIKAVEYGNTVFLDYPNLEVKRAMAQLYTELLLKGKVAGQVGAGDIVRVLNNDDPEEVFHILNRLFAAIDYQSYPVTDEASVRAFIQVYLAGAGLDPKVECHNAHGRSDLEVNVGARLWVFELKTAHEGKSADAALQEAINQLTSRRYEEQDAVGKLERVALVFSLRERRFVRWAAVPET